MDAVKIKKVLIKSPPLLDEANIDKLDRKMVYIQEIEQEYSRLKRERTEEASFKSFILFQRNGSRLEYEKVYFEKRRRLNTFALMAFLYPEKEDCIEHLEEIIWAICNEYTWCLPAHLDKEKYDRNDSLLSPSNARTPIDLFAAETAFSLAEIDYIMGERLDPVLRRRIRTEVFQRIFWPFHFQGPYHWETVRHNWASVCAGSIGAAAIYLVEDHEELSIILKRVLSAMDSYLLGFEMDGACLEGYGYWEYGFGYFVYFAELMSKKSGGKINLLDQEKVKEMALFQQKVFLYENYVANFSDSLPVSFIQMGLSHYLGKQFAETHVPEQRLRARYTDDHCSRWAPAFRNLIWVTDREKGNGWTDGSFYMEHAQWFTSRFLSNEDQYAFAAKGGHNDEPHNHNDVGHFILSASDERFFIDLGAGEYTKEYFGEQRYEYVCTGSHGHSVPIVNGGFQQVGNLRKAKVVDIALGDQEDCCRLDLTSAYGDKSLKKLTRVFRWKKREHPELQLLDTFHFLEKPSVIVERFIAGVFPIIVEEGGILLQGENSQLFIKYDHQKWRFERQLLSFSNHYGKREKFQQLDFIALKPGREEMVQFTFRFV